MQESEQNLNSKKQHTIKDPAAASHDEMHMLNKMQHQYQHLATEKFSKELMHKKEKAEMEQAEDKASALYQSTIKQSLSQEKAERSRL